jgi:hypothetical protein
MRREMACAVLEPIEEHADSPLDEPALLRSRKPKARAPLIERNPTTVVRGNKSGETPVAV